MENPKSNKLSFISVISSTVAAVKHKPAIIVPFVIFTLIDVLWIMLLFLAPRDPFIKLFGPPIRAIFGEKFLHYPVNFVLLPQLVSYSRMGLAVLFSSLLSGISVAILYKKPLKTAFKKYAGLFLIVFIIYALFLVLIKVYGFILVKYFMAGHKSLLFIGAKWWLGPISSAAVFVFSVILQVAFVYAIPVLIREDATFIKAVFKGVRFSAKNLLLTFFLIILPMLLYIPFTILTQRTTFLIDRFFPEVILILLVVSSIVNSLVIDPLITLSTALYYEKKQEVL